MRTMTARKSDCCQALLLMARFRRQDLKSLWFVTAVQKRRYDLKTDLIQRAVSGFCRFLWFHCF